jgi:hypothetical protein
MDFIRNLFGSSAQATPALKAPVETKPKSRTAYPSPSVDKSLSTVGYFLDFSQPAINGRPVYNSYNNYVYPAARVNLQGRALDCKQPVWGENCL